MKTETKKDTKQRIFDAAVLLFAQKGYTGVGIREIAKAANVQLSMVNYYFEGKIGILKEIINQCYDRYYHAIFSAGDENTPLEERVQMLIRNLVSFYRENMKIAIVAFNVIPVDIPEIIDLRIKWLESNREATERWYKFLGLDVANPVLMSIIHSYLTSIIFNFFEAQYCCNRIAKVPNLSPHAVEHFKHDDHSICVDDKFYDRYAEMLAKIYLHGITSVTGKKGG